MAHPPRPPSRLPSVRQAAKRPLIGTRIRERRLSLGRRQTEVARHADISAAYLNLIEHNRRPVGEALLSRLAEALEIDARERRPEPGHVVAIPGLGEHHGLDPRPEIITATRALSIMRNAPRLARAPRLRAAADGAAARAFAHLAHDETGLARRREVGEERARFVGRDREHHADAAVEGARHLGGFDMSLRLQKGHEPRLFPRVGIDMGVQAVGQDAERGVRRVPGFGGIVEQVAVLRLRLGLGAPDDEAHPLEEPDVVRTAAVGDDLLPGIASLFNGALFAATTLESVGVPDLRLFIRGDEVEGPAELRLELPVDARLPESYIDSERLRLEAYQKLSAAASPNARTSGGGQTGADAAASADAIDLANINFAAGQTVGFAGNSAGGSVTVSDGIHTASIALLGNYMASTFVAASDGHGGTTITVHSDQVATLAPPKHA